MQAWVDAQWLIYTFLTLLGMASKYYVMQTIVYAFEVDQIHLIDVDKCRSAIPPFSLAL